MSVSMKQVPISRRAALKRYMSRSDKFEMTTHAEDIDTASHTFMMEADTQAVHTQSKHLTACTTDPESTTGVNRC